MVALDGQQFADSAAIARWIVDGPHRTVHRDYDIADVLADASPHPAIDAAVIAVIDQGPATARQLMLGYLHLCPSSTPAMRAAYVRWAQAPWLAHQTPTGGLFGDLVSAAAQHGYNRDLEVVRAYLALGDRYNARRDWTWLALYAEPAGLGITCLEAALLDGMPLGEGDASSLAVTLGPAPQPVVIRAARALAGREPHIRAHFLHRLRSLRTDGLDEVERALAPPR